MEHRERIFERYAKRNGLCLTRREDGRYHIGTTRKAWEFWCTAYEAGRASSCEQKDGRSDEQRQGRSSLAAVVPRVG